MNTDKLAGTAKKVEGNVESAFGTVTGNKSAEGKGDAKRILGAAQEAFGKVEDYAADSYETVKNEINEKPVQSALIALGVGFLIGRLFSL
jgi:uncharacterized protein YjbJ (UPF0337 family)